MKAFPNVTGEKGMDLRDYFAAKVMPSVMADPDTLRNSQRFGEDFYVLAAIVAYRIADAMMQAREKNGGG
jgi:hypothetical protein